MGFGTKEIMKDFFKRLLDSKDSSANSKILITLVGLFLIIVTTILVLVGVPPAESIHVSKVIYGLVIMVLASAGIEVTNQIFGK